MIFVLLFFVLGTAQHSHGESTRAELFDEKITEATRLFTGLEGIKDYFRNNTNPLAKKILETFENECFYMEEPELPPEKSRKPFIVIEGNQKNSREVVGVRLAGLPGWKIFGSPCALPYQISGRHSQGNSHPQSLLCPLTVCHVLQRENSSEFGQSSHS
ncbi:uncharacterized protein LOC124352772 isoform X1 [Homalodisca vitripennis]|uniref:uncharacterized protein LOC124352772 isoform X1 n=1 Tax=Homalodisca vitripennis TaxID=197043 RepID=UPI001EE9D3FE|nr:uncharacterized protein LOC124352772 isoform X1 [Homalodisca vitripennis]